MNRKSVQLTRDQLIDTILEIPSLKEREWTRADLISHSNHELIALYERNDEHHCIITVKAEAFVPVAEEAWGYV